MKILINGVGYDTFNSTFVVYSMLPKCLISKGHVFNGNRIMFSDYTYGTVEVFTNNRGLKMLSVRGAYRGLSQDLHSYLIDRRADVTKYINNLKQSY